VLYALGGFMATSRPATEARPVIVAALFAAGLALITWAGAWAPSGERQMAVAALLRQAAALVAAAVFFTGIWVQRLPPPAAAAMAALGAALLAPAMWRFTSQPETVGGGENAAQPGAQANAVAVSCLVVALVAGQSSLALAFWHAGSLPARLALLAVFYATSGMMGAHQQDRGDWRPAAEYAAVAAAALALIVAVALRGP
jgi:hypothetical protein